MFWVSYSYFHFHIKGTLSYRTKQNVLLFKKWGVFYWASKSAISVGKGMFSFRQKSAKRVCYSNLSTSIHGRFGRVCVCVCVDTYHWITFCFFFVHLYTADFQRPLLIAGCQVLLNFSILSLKLHFCYWNFHKILAKIPKFVFIPQFFTHKNAEICVKLCKNSETIAICYWSEFPGVGSPVNSPEISCFLNLMDMTRQKRTVVKWFPSVSTFLFRSISKQAINRIQDSRLKKLLFHEYT